jgi:hypothetical protein
MSLYVYGLVRAGDIYPVAAPAVRDPNARVGTIDCGGVAALVSPIDGVEIMPRRRDLLAHARVLEQAMVDRPVLPMRFGIIVPNVGALARMIVRHQRDLLALLDEIDGRIEVGIKASWNEQIVWPEIAAAHPDLAAAGRDLHSGGAQRTYYDRIELGRAIAGAIEDKRMAERRRLLDLVSPLATRVKELPAADDMMFAHVALLVEKSIEPKLFESVASFERAQSARLVCKYVAPIPPYNFVALSLDWDQAAPAHLVAEPL